MKTLFFSIFILFSLKSFCQDFKVLLTRPIQLDNMGINISDSLKYETVKSLDHWLIKEHYGKYDWISLEEEIDDFIFLDLDMNNDLEIIYEGFSGGEPIGTTILKKNAKDKYLEVFSRFGKINSFWRAKINGDTYFELIQAPCCDGITYSKETWKYSMGEFQLLEKINWISGTKFPIILSSTKKFKVINSTYTLRSSPEIVDNNILTTYTTGDLGYAIAEQIDSTGRVWWFVMMLNNVNHADRTFYDYAYEDSYFSLGWMSSRYVELLTK